MRYAIRILRRSPWFTLAATLAIALGIGANTAIFSVVNAVLLKPLPYQSSGRLFAVSSQNLRIGQRDKVTGADLQEWRGRNRVFEDMAWYWDESHTITGTANTESVIGWEFSPNLFSMLGTPPLMGRTILPEDGQTGNHRVVVLSHRLWQRRFAGDANVVGRTMQLDGQDYTIIGVMSRAFAHPDTRTEIWTPLFLEPKLLDDRRLHVLHVLARTRPGVTNQQAQAEMDTIARHLAEERPATNGLWGVEVRPIRDLYAGSARNTLLLLQAAVFFILLISCANVANLLLVRAGARDREVAVRLAIGASRLQLLRQFLTEGILLAITGAAGGLLFAVWGVQAIPALFAGQLGRLPLPEGAGWIDGRVLLWTTAITVLVGLVFGSIPVFRSGGQALESLRSGTRGTTGGAAARRLRSALVVSQISFSLLLLIGAGLLIRSYVRLNERSFGFRTGNVLTVTLPLPAGNSGQVTAMLEQLQAGVRALPGVESVGLVSTVPLSGNNARRRYRLPGQPEAPNMETDLAEFRVATPDYFRTMGVALRKGRLFTDSDRAGGAGVIIVNETLARRLWPDADPIGQGLFVPDAWTPEIREVVGVVADTRHSGLTSEPRPEIYRPAYQASWPFYGLVVRTAGNPSALNRAVRDVVGSINRNIPVGRFQTMEELAAGSLAMQRSSMTLLAVFAAVSLLLATFGVYGVIAYGVTQRAREIGIRMALGASPGRVVHEIVGRGAALALTGLVLGLALSIALTRFLSTLLFGVTPTDAATFCGVSLVMFAVSLAASLVPARTAARMDPARTLRAD